MKRFGWLAGIAAIACCASLPNPALARRTVSVRTLGQRDHGARPDISVPYLNNGRNAFNAAHVAPRIYSSPIVDDPNAPQAKPVFNLIFYGSREGFGDQSNGATPRPANRLRQNK